MQECMHTCVCEVRQLPCGVALAVPAGRRVCGRWWDVCAWTTLASNWIACPAHAGVALASTVSATQGTRRQPPHPPLHHAGGRKGGGAGGYEPRGAHPTAHPHPSHFAGGGWGKDAVQARRRHRIGTPGHPHQLRSSCRLAGSGGEQELAYDFDEPILLKAGQDGKGHLVRRLGWGWGRGEPSACPHHRDGVGTMRTHAHTHTHIHAQHTLTHHNTKATRSSPREHNRGGAHTREKASHHEHRGMAAATSRAKAAYGRRLAAVNQEGSASARHAHAGQGKTAPVHCGQSPPTSRGACCE